MGYSHGTFLICGSDAIENLTFDDLFGLLASNDATEAVPEMAKLENLSAILTGSKEEFFTPIAHKPSETSVLFFVAPTLRDSFAAASNDRLGEVSSAWADSESWSGTGVNPFDLFGLLHYMNSLCVKARKEGKDLFLLLSSETDLAA